MMRNHAPLITGHALVEPTPDAAPLEFTTDQDTVNRCRDAVSMIGAQRQRESRLPLVRDTSFERGNAYIGACISDAAWVDDQWSSVPPSAYTEIAEAIASDDLTEAGRILQAAFKTVAHREAEAKLKIKF